MPRKSSNDKKMPKFKTETEEADWYHTPAGRQYMSREFEKAQRKAIIETESRAFDEVRQLVKDNPGRLVRVKNGLNVQRTDPAVLQELIDRVEAKKTQAVSLRLPSEDIKAAKALAEKVGIGYQTILKQLISEGLRKTY